MDPGWVPTRMGGPGAGDDLRLGNVTQAWDAAGRDAEAPPGGQYWHHQKTQAPHQAVRDERFQAALLSSLADYTGTTIQGGPK